MSASTTTDRFTAPGLPTVSRGTELRQVMAQRILPQRPTTSDDDSYPPVALVLAESVGAGESYPSTDGNGHFAVPAYALEVVDGRYTSSLRWRSPDADPNGPIAVLTLTFSLTMPEGAREIDCQPTVRLVHRVAVSDGAGGGSAALSTELGALERTSPTSARVSYGMTDKEEFDALWLAITTPDQPATVELSAMVQAGHRGWGHSGLPALEELRPGLPKVELVVPLHPERVEHPDWTRRAHSTNFGDQAVLADVATPVGEVAAPVAEQVTPAPQRFDVALDRPPGLVGPVGLRRRDDDGGVFEPRDPDLPGRVVVHSDLVATVIYVTLPLAASVGPFSFPVDTNAYMFDVPGDLRPHTNRLLLRHEFDPGGDRPRLVYYEDTAFTHRYYYEPQQFRVPRDDAKPYLPRFAIGFDKVVVSGDNGADTLHFNARLRFSAVPDLDVVVLAGLRRDLASRLGVTDPDLTALLPDHATLQLQLPDDAAGGALTTVTHTLTGNAFDDGFADEVELSAAEFAAAVALLQGDALRGTIVADLLGGTEHTEIPVELSLRDTPGLPLQRAYRGPVGDGLVRVTVTNPVESPLQIVELYGVSATGGVSAFPASQPGVVVAAGGSVDLDYRLTPPDAVLDDLVPSLRTVVDADLRVLLPQLMVDSGYSDETFTVTVRTDPAFLAGTTPDGPLVGVLVQFEGDVDVVLDAVTASRDAAVRMAIVPWLLKDPDAQRYRYRVVNLCGAADAPTQGQVGAWVDGLGAGTLTVAPVGS